MSDTGWATLTPDRQRLLLQHAGARVSIARDALHAALYPGIEVRESPLADALRDAIEQALAAATNAENAVIAFDATIASGNADS